MIEVRNLTKKYRELTVIDNFSHTFHEGKVYGVMGENGAGKSTLFRCIAGIELYDGTVIVSEDRQIGYMGGLMTSSPCLSADMPADTPWV